MTHIQYFKSREDEKSAISIGLSSFKTLDILQCKILSD
jgi:hypothetical protein